MICKALFKVIKFRDNISKPTGNVLKFSVKIVCKTRNLNAVKTLLFQLLDLGNSLRIPKKVKNLLFFFPLQPTNCSQINVQVCPELVQ